MKPPYDRDDLPGTLLSFLPSETGLGFILRDRGGAAEEEMGIIQFECLTNDREPGKLIKLLTLKSIFSRQLPKMPREYLTRLTFDRQHYCLALLKQVGRRLNHVCVFMDVVCIQINISTCVRAFPLVNGCMRYACMYQLSEVKFIDRDE